MDIFPPGYNNYRRPYFLQLKNAKYSVIIYQSLEIIRRQLFMIAAALVYFKCSVQLLKQHYAEKLVGKGHIRKRKAQVGALLDPRRQPVGAADNKGKR